LKICRQNQKSCSGLRLEALTVLPKSSHEENGKCVPHRCNQATQLQTQKYLEQATFVRIVDGWPLMIVQFMLMVGLMWLLRPASGLDEKCSKRHNFTLVNRSEISREVVKHYILQPVKLHRYYGHNTF